MRAILEYFVRRPMLASLFTIAVLLLGLNAARTMRRDIFPAVDFGVVFVQTAYPGASPQDVELNVTNRIEDELRNVTGIRQMTSVSMENLSSIEVTLDPDVQDDERVKRDIRNAVGRVTDLPEEVTEAPLVLEIDTSLINICEVGITGDLPYAQLREIARQFEKKLKAVPGVSRVARSGYRAREVRIEVSPQAVESYQIPLREIVQAIRARNIRLTGGTFESYTSEKNVVTLAQFDDPQEVGEVIVRSTFEGPLIRIRDLAVIRDDFEAESVISRMEGRKAISFEVYKKEQADVIRTVDAVKRLIEAEGRRGIVAGTIDLPEPQARSGLGERLRRLLAREPVGPEVYRYGPVQILLSNDLSHQVRDRFQIVVSNGIMGLVLVVLTLTAFLNLRTSLWVALGIPVALLGTLFLLPGFDVYLDTITLTSMILLIGIIVDDGIIISENIHRRREMGEAPVQAAAGGAHEVFFPVVTTVTTTLLAFAPMFFMTGIIGKFTRVIPLTVTLALLISLAESTLALPAHLVGGMARASRRGPSSGLSSARRWFERLKSGYARLFLRLLRFRYLLVGAFFLAFAGALWYATNYMEFLLFPSRGAERFLIGLELRQGSSLPATAERVEEVERIVRLLPPGELDTFVTRIGQNMTGGVGENFAYILVGLTPYSRRTRTVDQVIEELRPRIEAAEGIDEVTFVVDAGGPPVGKPITLRIIGNDDDARRRLAAEVMGALRETPGVKDPESDDKTGKDQLEIRIDYTRLARLGLTAADVAQTVRIAYDGEVVTRIREGDEDVDFRVQLEPQARQQVDTLRRLPVPNSQNRLVPLGQATELVSATGPSAYRHFDGERSTTIEADVDQEVTTPLEATLQVMSRFTNLDRRYPDTRIRVGGEAEETESSIAGLATSFLLAVVGIYFSLLLLFNSFTQPFLVMLSIPFGISGVVLAFALHGQSLSFMGMLGLIGMAGVVVNDSLVLVSHLNGLRKKHPDEPALKLIAEGTSHRLRAILLTSITTAAGLMPLAYGIGGTDLYMQPMALALGYGILLATPMTLILIPSLYAIGLDLGRFLHRRRRAEKA